jgi:GR25 family glycosyltransferase involved in LPS biosynthesis
MNNNILMDLIDKYKVKVINIENNKNTPINSKVNKIYVINLLENKLNRNYILILMKKYNINFTLVVVERVTDEIYSLINKTINISKSELGCSLSHLWCLNNIIKNSYDNAIIFEDDVIFHKKFTKLFLETIKKPYDFLLLGACDFNFASNNYKNYKNGQYFPSNFNKLYGAHANYYSLAGAKKMFEIKTNSFSFFDKDYNLIFNEFNNSSAVCYPNLVASDISKSDINHTYKLLSLTEKYYYDKCFDKFSFKHYNFIYINIFKNSEINYNKFDNYEKYIDCVLYNYFYDEEKIQIIKNRLALNFFNMEDVKALLFTE